jgi:hypothetical protein
MAEDLSWRLRVGSGSGFAATSTQAVTCAHVVDRDPWCAVAPLGGGVERRRPVRPVAAWPADPRADLAVVDITGHPGSVAPIGPRPRPRAGTVVTILGLLGESEIGLLAGDHLGRRVRARVTGADASGGWLQINPVDGLQYWVDGGFSGAAAVDGTTGCVVGMVVASDLQTTAWLIPLDTIIERLPWLGATTGDPLRTDPDFVRFHDRLQAGRYDEAMAALSTVEPRFRAYSDTYFYWALTMLGGYRPAFHSAPSVEAIEKVLLEACRLDPRSPHARALLALVHEDFYTRSALAGPRPDLSGAAAISRDRAAEIVRHVPAPECRAWQLLRRNS